MISVMIADDHEIVRSGFRRLLEEVPDMRLCGEAASEAELLRRLKEVRPDVLILDVNMPDSNGCETLRRVLAKPDHPRVVMFTMYQEDSAAIPFLHAGASGFISKRRSSRELLDAIRKVHAGKRYITSDLAEHLFTNDLNGDQPLQERLSEREVEVVRHLANGLKSVEIAEKLGVSSSTVNTFVHRCKEKLGIRSIVELVRFAKDHNLLG